MQYWFLSILCCLVFPLGVLAHVGGGTYEVTREGYFVDIGYTPAVPTTDFPARFDFSIVLENSTSTEDIFTDVWIRIEQEGALLFSGALHRPIFGPTGFTYQFNEAGSYDIFARFQSGTEILLEEQFAFVVVEPQTVWSFVSEIYWFLGGVVTFTVVLLWRRTLRKKL